MNKTYDVIIGGAGPVGLFLACELGMAGISVLVLEQETKISSPLKAMPLGMRGLNTLSIEAFYRRGLIGKIFDPGEERPTNIVKTSSFQFGGHFAGIMVDANKLDLSRWKYRLPGPSLLPGATNPERLTTVLPERAENLGVTILRSGVTGLTQDSDAVTVQSSVRSFRGKYLVGCDGGRSTIRKASGFEFVGTDPEFTGYATLCELDNSEKLKPGFQVTPWGMYIFVNQGHFFVVDFDGGTFDRAMQATAPTSTRHWARKV